MFHVYSAKSSRRIDANMRIVNIVKFEPMLSLFCRKKIIHDLADYRCAYCRSMFRRETISTLH